MQYRVTKIFSRGSESPSAEFAEQSEAIHYIQEKLGDDKRFKIVANYRLYDFSDLLKEYTPADYVDASSASSASQSSATFNPTPFNTAPRPGGVPHSWVKDMEDKEKE